MPGKAQLHHKWDLGEIEQSRRYGKASLDLSTAPVVAGEPAKIGFRFEAGETTIPVGGRIRFAWRWPFDWDVPRIHSMALPPSTSVEATFEPRGDLDAWNHHIELKVTSGALNRGDVAAFQCGGEPGWGAPTFATRGAGFLVAIDPDGSDHWVQLVDPPGFAIEAGPPMELLVVSPGRRGRSGGGCRTRR